MIFISSTFQCRLLVSVGELLPCYDKLLTHPEDRERFAVEVGSHRSSLFGVGVVVVRRLDYCNCLLSIKHTWHFIRTNVVTMSERYMARRNLEIPKSSLENPLESTLNLMRIA